MNYNELIEKSEKLQRRALAYEEVLTKRYLSDAFNNSGMVSTDKMQENIMAVQEEGRLLNIGVIGRVKAGKSSLLNSLFFNGQSVLPKAATPMTAALTTMTYGNNVKAKIQFYSKKDLQIIRNLAEQYQNEFDNERKSLIDQQRKRFIKNLGAVNREIDGPDEELKIDEAKISRRVRAKLSENLAINAAYLQQQEINKSPAPQLIDSSYELVANTIEELKQQLSDYVGANGKYTAYTKAVDLFLPFNELKGIKVIDTPGVNDPIVSREQRTNELLMSCDVVLIVSPAGKFFDIKDQQLMTRLTTKEGLQNIYFIASQSDSTLNAPEYSGKLLSEAIPMLMNDLSRHLENELIKMPDSSKEIIDILRKGDSLKERFVLVSAIADSINQKNKEKFQLLDDESHALSNIKESFPTDYNSSSEQCLQKLSGIEKVREFIKQSSSEKEKIISERQNKIVEQYCKILVSYQQHLRDVSSSRYSEIHDVDMAKLLANRNVMESCKVELQSCLDVVYADLTRDLRRRLNKIGALLTEFNQNLYSEANNSLSSVTRSGSRPSDSFWGLSGKLGFKEKYSYTVNILHTNNISRELSIACQKYNGLIVGFFDDILGGDKGFEKKLCSSLFSELQKIYNKSESHVLIDINASKKAINDIICAIPIPKFADRVPLPSNLKAAGDLSGYSADEYHENATRFIDELNEIYSNKANKYIDLVFSNLPKKISSELLNELDNQILQAEYDIKNKNKNLYLLKKFNEELEGIEL